MTYVEIGLLLILLGLSMSKWKVVEEKYNKFSYVLIFLLAFLCYFIRLLELPDMIAQSGDSTSIWKTIKTYYSNQITSSYVLYKGMGAVYPYVWLYKLAEWTNADAFFYIKIYTAILFAYIAAYGIPKIYENVSNKNLSMFKRWLFVVVIYHMQKENSAYTNISVDIPSLFFFVLLIKKSIDVNVREKSVYVYDSILIGLALGATLCFSGQFLISAVVGFILIVVVFKKKMPLKKVLMYMSIVIIMACGVKGAEANFEKKIVEPMRESGEWLPEGSDWVIHHLTTRELPMGMFYNGVNDESLLDSQVCNIFEWEEENFSTCISAGDYILEYFRVVLKHPVDFIVSCFNKAFLAFTLTSSAEYNYILLISGYALLYMGITKFFEKNYFEKKNSIIEWLVFIAFVCTILPSCALHMEMRYAIGVQMFVYGYALWEIKALKLIGEEHHKCSFSRYFSKERVLYIICAIVFVIMCMAHYLALID